MTIIGSASFSSLFTLMFYPHLLQVKITSVRPNDHVRWFSSEKHVSLKGTGLTNWSDLSLKLLKNVTLRNEVIVNDSDSLYIQNKEWRAWLRFGARLSRSVLSTGGKKNNYEAKGVCPKSRHGYYFFILTPRKANVFSIWIESIVRHEIFTCLSNQFHVQCWMGQIQVRNTSGRHVFLVQCIWKIDFRGPFTNNALYLNTMKI